MDALDIKIQVSNIIVASKLGTISLAEAENRILTLIKHAK